MKPIQFAVGTYTETQPHVPHAKGEGISLIALDEDSGRLTLLSTMGGIINPTYLHWNGDKKMLFTITEEEGPGWVQGFTIDSEKSELSPEEILPGPGAGGCHLSGMGDRLFATAYGGGTMTAYRLDDGLLSETIAAFSYHGNGANRNRQEAPHLHQAVVTPDGELLYLCDLGSDKIWTHELSSGLPGVQKIALSLPSGYGPRHLILDPESPTAFILCELIPKLLTAIILPDGSMTIVDETDMTLRNLGGKDCAPAAVKIHPSGKTLAVSNRFCDTITVFAIVRWDGGAPFLKKLEEFSCGGKTPRDITFSPSGRWLLMANQDSDTITTRSFHPQDGIPLEPWGPEFSLGTPVCVVPLD